MDLAKKYGVVAFFGVLAIVSSMAADISDYLSGLVLGVGASLALYGLYKMVSVAAAAKKQEQSQENE